MENREYLARKIMGLYPSIDNKDLIELCVKDMLDRFDEEQLKVNYGFKFLMKNKDQYPDEWKKVCELLDAA